MKIVFVTNNPNKLKEVKKLVPNTIKILSLKDIGCFEDIEETGKTLQENAIIKANFVTKNYGFNCFADDTGLEINYLNGQPGVYSARYASLTNNAEANMKKVLLNLNNTTNRSAQFKTVIALNLTNNQYLFTGVCKGEILYKKQGDNGFGYDPIFKPNGFDMSFAQMSITQKGKISHRGKAMIKLVTFLNKI